jgi:plasmid maintenance system antidote protein VapI
LPEISKANDFSLSASLLDGEETDEVTLTKRLHDYLLAIRYYPHVESIPFPGILLDEYLCALGPHEPSFWRKLPMATIFRVTEGELPISSALSAQLSRVFGTYRRFWYDLQVEYDRCKSGTWDRLDSLEQSGIDEEEDFDT